MDTSKSGALTKAGLLAALLLPAALLLATSCKKGGGGDGGDGPTGPDVPSNKPASATITAPSSAQVPTLQEIAIRYRLQDADGITQADLSGTFPDNNNNYQITKTFPDNTTSWDTTINRTLIAPGTANYEVILTSKTPTGTETTSKQKNTQITQKQTSDTQFPFSIQNTRAQQPTTYQLIATDTDTIKTAVIKEVFPQTSDTTTTTITDIKDTEFNKELQKTFTKPGTYSLTLTITDKYDNKQTTTKTAQVLAEITQRTITLNTDRQQANAQLAFDFQQQTTSKTTNNQGIATFTVNAPKDSAIQYAITADALGLQQTNKQETSTKDTTTTLTIPATPITLPATLPGQYPRTTDTLNIRELITATDTEGEVPLTITLQYDANNLEITKTATNTYTFTTNNQTDPANTLEEILITAQAPYNQQSTTATKQIFDRRDILYLQTSFNTKEQDSLIIPDLRSILESEATITTASITTTQQGLTIRQEDEWGWVLKPQQATTYTFSINAQNRDGKQESETATLTVEPLPRANITVINTTTDEQVPSYLLLRDSTNSVIDSLTSSNGVFSDVPIPPQTRALSAAYIQNGQVKSFEHYIKINAQESITRTIPVVTTGRYDINKVKTGEFSLFDMRRLKETFLFVHGYGLAIDLDGNTLSGDGFGGVFHRVTESLNGVSFDELIIPDTTIWTGDGVDEVGIMKSGIPELIAETYESQIAPLMGEFKTPAIFKEKITYDTENRRPNVAYMNPRLIPDALGLIGVFGELPYTTLQTLAQIKQDGANQQSISPKSVQRVTLQELTNGTIYFSGLPADFTNPNFPPNNPPVGEGIPLQYQLGPEESIIHDETTRLDLSDWDRKAGFIVYEPHMIPGERVEHILYVPASWKEASPDF